MMMQLPIGIEFNVPGFIKTCNLRVWCLLEGCTVTTDTTYDFELLSVTGKWDKATFNYYGYDSIVPDSTSPDYFKTTFVEPTLASTDGKMLIDISAACSKLQSGEVTGFALQHENDVYAEGFSQCFLNCEQTGRFDTMKPAIVVEYIPCYHTLCSECLADPGICTGCEAGYQINHLGKC